MTLIFKEATSNKEIEAIYNYTIDAFSDSPDFKWTLKEIKQEFAGGWSIFSVDLAGEIIAALFLKLEKGTLYTKNTAIKMQHQGSGYSHRMKEFFEESARKLSASKIIHYCRIDNFRMYSLNESHGYFKCQDSGGEDEHIVAWEKKL
jgi:predicted GNAT family acetyltransferase